MLRWACTCFFIALVAILLGFQDVAGISPESASLVLVVAVTAGLVGATAIGRSPVR